MPLTLLGLLCLLCFSLQLFDSRFAGPLCEMLFTIFMTFLLMKITIVILRALNKLMINSKWNTAPHEQVALSTRVEMSHSWQVCAVRRVWSYSYEQASHKTRSLNKRKGKRFCWATDLCDSPSSTDHNEPNTEMAPLSSDLDESANSVQEHEVSLYLIITQWHVEVEDV